MIIVVVFIEIRMIKKSPFYSKKKMSFYVILHLSTIEPLIFSNTSISLLAISHNYQLSAISYRLLISYPLFLSIRAKVQTKLKHFY